MISEKQKKILAFKYSDYDALICDGAVRSGKTSIETLAFVDWAMENFSNQRFGICGKTVGSATENIIIPYISMSYSNKQYTIHWRRSEKIMEVRCGRRVNFFEVFGGKDEASYALIQGRTLAGVLLDEVVLMPESFVNQALARCSVDGAKIWFSCNPGNPQHWFKREWIDQREKHNALYLHFAMTDNPSLSEKTLARYQSMYSGVFYQRYVQGLWVAAEGLVYPMFDESVHVVDNEPSASNKKWYIAVDYGTVNPTAAELWCVNQGNGTAYLANEYYYDSRAQDENGHSQNPRRTDEEHYAELEKLAGNLRIERVIVDPSAASFKETIRRHGKFNVWDADNSVLDGIRLMGTLLQAGRITVNRNCGGFLGEIAQYRWDEESTEDSVIKEFDHAMDAARYFVQTVMRREVRTYGIT